VEFDERRAIRWLELCGWSVFVWWSAVQKGGKRKQFIPGVFFFFRCVCGGTTCVGEVKSESEKVLRGDRMVFIL
jgi:hypothetical protein